MPSVVNRTENGAGPITETLALQIEVRNLRDVSCYFVIVINIVAFSSAFHGSSTYKISMLVTSQVHVFLKIRLMIQRSVVSESTKLHF